MSTIRFQGRVHPAQGEETVLETLLRGGESIANSCRAGICRSCLVRVEAGEVEPGATEGLEPRLVEKGYVFSCRARPRGDLTIGLGDAIRRVPARIVGRERLSETVLSLRVDPESAFPFEPGQYATLHRSDGLARPYSIASQPEDGPLEFQIRLVPGGAMTPWLFEAASVGEEVEVSGPAGDCVYRSPDLDEPLLLVGFGTGLAPMWGILGRARSAGHRGEILVVQVGLRLDRLYLHEELRRLAEDVPNLRYVASVLEGEAAPDLVPGEFAATLAGLLPSAKGWRVHLAGAPDLVAAAQRRLFLAGASPFAIHVDAFASAPPG